VTKSEIIVPSKGNSVCSAQGTAPLRQPLRGRLPGSPKRNPFTDTQAYNDFSVAAAKSGVTFNPAIFGIGYLSANKQLVFLGTVAIVPIPGHPGEPGELRLSENPIGGIDFTWVSPSGGCVPLQSALYQGNLSTLPAGSYDHGAVVTCSAIGANNHRGAMPAADGAYFLVTDLTSSAEGSYGRSTTLAERPASPSACIGLQDLTVCP
jgi:hypothetical protein